MDAIKERYEQIKRVVDSRIFTEFLADKLGSKKDGIPNKKEMEKEIAKDVQDPKNYKIVRDLIKNRVQTFIDDIECEKTCIELFNEASSRMDDEISNYPINHCVKLYSLKRAFLLNKEKNPNDNLTLFEYSESLA